MNIKVVCRANICRSPMGEYFFKKHLQKNNIDDINVSSAGYYADDGLSAAYGAQMAMLKSGINISWHKSKKLRIDDLESETLIITVEESLRRKIEKDLQIAEQVPSKKIVVYTLAQCAGYGGDIEDPINGTSSVYEEVAHKIENMVEVVVQKFVLDDE